ncbi:MAG: DMT family transporter [Nitratireductor sp.]|nr:DMT family transporter [Nitratireductor sp.]
MPIHEMAALLAATCWALSSVVSAGPVAHLGPLAFTRIRMTIVLFMLAGWAIATGGWQTIAPDQLLPIGLSGAIGIFIGDTMLFMALSRVGPRRSSIVFATHAPMSVLLGWLFLGETLSGRELAGIALVIVGVILAIIFGKRRSQLHHWESVKGPLWIGIAFGLGAALSQAVGSLIARPVMETGVDAGSVSAVRVGVSVVCFYIAYLFVPRLMRPANPLTWNVGLTVAFSGFIAMALGMTFVLFALAGGEVGIVATLSATAPALILPIIWIRTGEMPAWGAWIGAALVVVGSSLIVTV